MKRAAMTFVAIVALSVFAFVAWVALSDPGPMPPVIWLRSDTAEPDTDVDPSVAVRIGSPDGPVFTGARKVSSWSSPGEPGISLRRELTDSERAQLRLAKLGVLPRYRVYGAGYSSTGRSERRNDAFFHEFRLFDEQFSYWQYGWWQK
jgi:hypothetical protein